MRREQNIHPSFAEYNQQDATFHNLFISVRRCTFSRWFFLPSSGAQNCTYSVRYLSGQYCYLLLARAKLWKAASCWLYSANILGLHGSVNIKIHPSLCCVNPHRYCMVAVTRCEVLSSSMLWTQSLSCHCSLALFHVATLMSLFPFIRTINKGYHIESNVRVLQITKQVEGY